MNAFNILKNNLLSLTALILTLLLVTSCSDDDKVERYKVYNIDTGAEVPIYDVANSDSIISTVPSRTDCIVYSKSTNEDSKSTEISVDGGITKGRILGKYLFVKEIDNEPGYLEKLRGHDSTVDKIISWVDSVQDSHLHYTSNTFWLKFKLSGVFVLFIIGMIFLITEWNKTGSKKWYWGIIVAAIGIWLMYYEFVDYVVMGDGYFRAIYTDPFHSDEHGLLVNILIIIFLGMLYLAVALTWLAIMFMLQCFIAPAIHIAMCGVSLNSVMCVTAMTFIVYIGAVVELFVSPEYMPVVAYVTFGIAAIPLVLSIYFGIKSGYWQSILAVIMPILYILAVIVAFFVAKSMLYLMGVLGICFLIFGVATTSSKFQSQGSGKTYRIVGQDGQTKATVDDQGIQL